MDFKIKPLVEVINIKTGKLNSNAAVSGGTYPFFTCAPEPLTIDRYKYDQAAILLAGNNAEGNFHINFYEGKFEAYQRTYIIDSKDVEKYDLKYLYYALKECLAEFKLMSQGTSTKFLTMAILNSFKLNIPSIDNQRRVAKILSLLDRKIENNKNINNNLLQQAQALYKETFPYSPSDSLPESWSVGTVGDIIEIHDSKRVPLSGAKRAKMENKIYPYYGAASLMDYVDEYIFDGKYLLLGEDGTVIDDAGYPILQYVWGKFWVNNHAHIMTGKLGYNVESLYMLFKHTPVSSIVTGAVQLKISQSNLRSIPVVIPPEQIIADYNHLIEPMFAIIRANEEENRTLASIRDNLLPKLMSDELDISNITL